MRSRHAILHMRNKTHLEWGLAQMTRVHWRWRNRSSRGAIYQLVNDEFLIRLKRDLNWSSRDQSLKRASGARSRARTKSHNERNRNTSRSQRYFYATSCSVFPRNAPRRGGYYAKTHRATDGMRRSRNLRALHVTVAPLIKPCHGNRSPGHMHNAILIAHERPVIQECASMFIARTKSPPLSCFIKPHRNALIDTIRNLRSFSPLPP